MLMGQRNSEDTHRNSMDNNRLEALDHLDYSTQIRELKRELAESKARLKEVEGKFNKIKVHINRSLLVHILKYSCRLLVEKL
jgi:hypothetical protein